jgi:TonB family protein
VAEEEPKQKPIVPIAIAAAVIIALAVGAFFMMRKKAPAPQTQVAAKQVTPVPQSAPTATDSAVTTAAMTDLTTTAATTALGTSDQQLIDEEVQKRLAAEKARLDQQRAQQLAQQQAAQPLPAVTAQATPQPVPVAPTPVQEAPPQPAPQQAAPAQPQAAAPAERQYRQGDLVPVGTEGLVAPEMVRFNKPAYPPAARARRIEGLVVLNVLVSEEGRPLDIRVLRGVTPDVGINAAAVEAVRGSTFRPATKDGVRVKAYKTVTIPFKL